MPTTLEVWGSRKVGNYSTAPTIDVTILPDEYECAVCDQPCRYDSIANKWVHLRGVEPHESPVAPISRCRFCHAQGTLTYTAHAWYDDVACSRCGGHDGYALGD